MKKEEKKRIQAKIRNDMKQGARVKVVQPNQDMFAPDRPPTLHEIMVLDKNTFKNNAATESFIRPFFPYEMPGVPIKKDTYAVFVMKLSPHEIRRVPLTKIELARQQSGIMTQEEFEMIVKDRSTYDVLLESEEQRETEHKES